jgi:hypothetical protein
MNGTWWRELDVPAIAQYPCESKLAERLSGLEFSDQCSVRNRHRV